MKSIHFNGSNETIELILRTNISVNQLSVSGAVPDLRGELDRDSKGATGNLESMVFPPEFTIANPVVQTDAEELGNLLREYAQKFAELPE